jgi:hypothetical protein
MRRALAIGDRRHLPPSANRAREPEAERTARTEHASPMPRLPPVSRSSTIFASRLRRPSAMLRPTRRGPGPSQNAMRAATA